MIKRAKDMVKEVKVKMREGKGSAELTHIFTQEELTSRTRICAKITIEPGSSIGLHDHVNEEEIYYILTGTGVVDDNGTIKDIGPGDALLTGGGASHSIENTGKTTMEMIAVVILF